MRMPTDSEMKAAAATYRRTDIPVEVITAHGSRLICEVFPDLAAARVQYPDLDLFHGSCGFTWAMKGFDFKTNTIRARFESDEAYRMLSE